MSKRIVCVLLAVGLLLASLAGCGGKEPKENYKATFAEAETLNANSDLGGFGLLQHHPQGWTNEQYGYDPDISPPPRVDFLPPELQKAEDGYGYYSFYPFEDKAYRLTEINLNSDAFHVYGIRVGSELAQASDVLEEQGYVFSPPVEVAYKKGTMRHAASKAHISIFLHTKADSDIITQITVVTGDPDTPPIHPDS